MAETIDLFNRFNDLNNANIIRHMQSLRELGNLRRNRKYKIFPRIDPFSRYDDNEFRSRYRMTKQVFNQLFEMLDGQNTLNPLVRNYYFE